MDLLLWWAVLTSTRVHERLSFPNQDSITPTPRIRPLLAYQGTDATLKLPHLPRYKHTSPDSNWSSVLQRFDLYKVCPVLFQYQVLPSWTLEFGFNISHLQPSPAQLSPTHPTLALSATSPQAKVELGWCESYWQLAWCTPGSHMVPWYMYTMIIHICNWK